jgi:hypothetical protein
MNPTQVFVRVAASIERADDVFALSQGNAEISHLEKHLSLSPVVGVILSL